MAIVFVNIITYLFLRTILSLDPLSISFLFNFFFFFSISASEENSDFARLYQHLMSRFCKQSANFQQLVHPLLLIQQNASHSLLILIHLLFFFFSHFVFVHYRPETNKKRQIASSIFQLDSWIFENRIIT